MKNKVFLLAVFVLFLIPSFTYSQPSDKLVVYCGITMLKPMVEISKKFEKEHGCKIQFVKGGSGKLLQLLLKNKNGDLYLPGSDSYIKKMEAEYPGLITAKAHVGYNKAAILVKKGNPKGITPDLNNFHSKQFKVIIGSDQKGSIGKETKKILSKHGSYEKVKTNAVLTLHSQSLVNAIKAGKADLSINWFAVSTWPENREHVDAIEISEDYAKKKRLVLAVLKDSKQAELAQSFLKLALSDYGKKVFGKYGLTN